MPVEPPVVSPRTLAEAYAILAGAPHRPVAGGTDLLVQLTGELGPVPERVIDLWRVEELRGIRVRDGALELGALTTYTQIRRSDDCAVLLPALVDAAATIGAAQIQNRGTIGGNAMNASPAGDTLPVLLALDATMVVGGAGGEREVPATDFWPAYRRTAVLDGELLVRIRIPVVDARRQAFRKVGTRRAQAISKVVLAASWRREGGDPEGRGGTWRDVRIAFGSVAATPVRATAAEAALEGRPPTPEAVDAAVEALRGELQPIDDVRSTGAYRLEVAGRILRRVLEEAT
jgi:CO/xanthine dehydrogenase FAD-binding subunit